MPRVMRKPLRAHFHTGNERTFGQIPRVIGIDLRADFDNFVITLVIYGALSQPKTRLDEKCRP